MTTRAHNVDEQGRRPLKLNPGDTCLILRPIENGFQTIVLHNFHEEMPKDDRVFYHILTRGLVELAVENTQTVIDRGVEAVNQPTLGVRPVDSDGNIIETAEPQPLVDGTADLEKLTPRGNA